MVKLTRFVALGAAGCLPALFGSVAAFNLPRFLLSLTTIDAAFTTWMTLMLVPLSIQLAGAVYVRMRVSERQTRLARLGCPACGNAASMPVSRGAGKRIQIGSEGKWGQVSIAGIS